MCFYKQVNKKWGVCGKSKLFSVVKDEQKSGGSGLEVLLLSHQKKSQKVGGKIQKEGGEVSDENQKVNSSKFRLI